MANSVDHDQTPIFAYTSRKHTYIILTPLIPTFIYIVKPVLQGYTLFFLFCYNKRRLCVLVKTAETVLTSTHNLCFEQEYEKYQNFLSENFPFLFVKFSIYLNRHVFVMYLRRTGLSVRLFRINNC